MKVVIFGGTGQLGRELLGSAPPEVEIYAYSSAEVDLRNRSGVVERVREVAPTVVINAAAYSQVDKAEYDRETAFAVNADGATHVAEAAGVAGAYLIHLSTDYVFAGDGCRPCRPGDLLAPVNVYGVSKRAGEDGVLAAAPACAVVRTAWLYSVYGDNFVKTMLRLFAGNSEVRVVVDQVGTPTWAFGLAEMIWRLCRSPKAGIFHWSDAGVASWYDFAVAVQEEALALGILLCEVPVVPVSTVEHRPGARRPAFSVLDKTDTYRELALQPIHWRVMLRRMLRLYKER